MMRLATLKKLDVRIYAALVSVILCLIAYSKNEPVNYDGILYLTAAKTYLQSGMTAAMQLYPWPFYPIIIAWVTKVTFLPVLYAAYFINNLFLIIIVTAFITIVKELGGSARVQAISAVVILVYPQLNDYRDFIIRDFGYWAFFLLAFWQLLCFSRTKHWLNAIAWGMAILLATLFRIEGFVLLLLAPVILLFLSQQSLWTRIRLFLQAYSVCVLGLIVIGIDGVKNPAVFHHLGRATEALQQLQHGWQFIWSNFHNKALIAGNTILSPYATAQAPVFVFWGLGGLFIGLFIATLSPLYVLLTGYAAGCGLLKLYKNDRRVLYYFVALNLLIPMIFFLQQFFLSNRYLLALCLLLLLWVPFALEQLFIDWKYKSATLLGQPWVFPLIALSMLAMAMGAAINYGYSKAYITEAGQWLAENTPVDSKLYSNNKQILFYANRTPVDLTVNWLEKYDDSKPLQTVMSNAWRGYNYVALRITHQSLADEQPIIKIMGQPVKIFHNKRGDEVLIFKLK